MEGAKYQPHSPSRNYQSRYEELRRNNATKPLHRDHVIELLGMVGQMLDERRRLLAALDRLGPSFADVRTALNELTGVLR